MKNISFALNAILIVAVAILYYLHFNKKDITAAVVDEKPTKILPLQNVGIVYINSDSLLEKYEFFKNERSQLEAAQNRIRAELKNQSEQLQQEAELYQQQAIGMTDMQRAKKEEELTMKQQQLMQRKEELLNKLDEDQSKSSEELYSRLNQFLSKYNKYKNYQ